jgi:hypothetical protein
MTDSEIRNLSDEALASKINELTPATKKRNHDGTLPEGIGAALKALAPFRAESERRANDAKADKMYADMQKASDEQEEKRARMARMRRIFGSF